MADYQEATITGSKWRRCSRINIENPLNGIPSVLFVEEDVINIGEANPIKNMCSNISITLQDPSEVIPLRNPLTWELTDETTTLGEIYAAIASVYWKKALDRDNTPQISPLPM